MAPDIEGLSDQCEREASAAALPAAGEEFHNSGQQREIKLRLKLTVLNRASTLFA
jgi:hypothetical protein